MFSLALCSCGGGGGSNSSEAQSDEESTVVGSPSLSESDSTIESTETESENVNTDLAPDNLNSKEIGFYVTVRVPVINTGAINNEARYCIYDFNWTTLHVYTRLNNHVYTLAGTDRWTNIADDVSYTYTKNGANDATLSVNMRGGEMLILHFSSPTGGTGTFSNSNGSYEISFTLNPTR